MSYLLFLARVDGMAFCDGVQMLADSCFFESIEDTCAVEGRAEPVVPLPSRRNNEQVCFFSACMYTSNWFKQTNFEIRGAFISATAVTRWLMVTRRIVRFRGKVLLPQDLLLTNVTVAQHYLF